MKKIYLLILIIVFANINFAQTKVEQFKNFGKIAVINTESFNDKETGIKEIVEANEKLDKEFEAKFKELNLAKEESQHLFDDLERLSRKLSDNALDFSPEENFKNKVIEKVNFYKLKSSKFIIDKNRLDFLYEKRKTEIFADVNKKIAESIKQFIKQNNYYIVLESSQINSSFVIIEGETVDITKDFISFYNSSIKKTN